MLQIQIFRNTTESNRKCIVSKSWPNPTSCRPNHYYNCESEGVAYQQIVFRSLQAKFATVCVIQCAN